MTATESFTPDPVAQPDESISVPDALNGRTGILHTLAQRRDEIRRHQVLTIPVPRWDNPQLKIRFHPIDHKVLRRGTRQIERAQEREKDSAKIAQVEVDVNSDVIAMACDEVIAVIDGVETSLGLHGEPVGIGPDLAVGLGLTADVGARAVVKKLFITDADIMTTARQLAEWSGYRDNAGDEDFSGE